MAVKVAIDAAVDAGRTKHSASGNPMREGEVSWINEVGPELWVALSNGRILSHADSMKAVTAPAQPTPSASQEGFAGNVYLDGEAVSAWFERQFDRNMAYAN